MPTVRFYASFSKKRNSTKRPSNSSSDTTVTCTFKEDTSIKNPILIFKGQKFDANYCYIADTLSYYYVEDIISRTKYETEYHLKLDVLATYKTQIGLTVARIAFSSTGYDKFLPDPRIAVSSAQHIYPTSKSSGIDYTIDNYIVGIAGNLGILFYRLNSNEFNLLLKNLMNPDLSAQFRNYFSNPMDAIVSAIWIPYYSKTDAGGITMDLVVGDVTLDGSGDTIHVTGDVINTDVIELKVNDMSGVAIPIPYKNQDFRDLQPYTSASLYLPGVGETDLNISDFIDSKNVSINARIDVKTGNMIYRIYNDDGVVLKTVFFSAGVSVPITSMSKDIGGFISNVSGYIGSTGNLLSGIPAGNFSSAMSMVANLAGVAMSSNMRSYSVKGSYEGRSDFADPLYTLTLVCKDTEDPDDANYIAKRGRPVCATHAINTHSGYVECEHASVALKASSAEIEEVNSYLNSGFYYE